MPTPTGPKSAKRAARDKEKADAFQPTRGQRRKVQMLAAFKVPKSRIRLMIINPKTGQPISQKNFDRTFSDDIEIGQVMFEMELAESLRSQAIGAPALYDQDGNRIVSEIKPNPIVGIYLSKAIMGLRDNDPVANGDPEEIAENLKTAIRQMKRANGSGE